MKDERPQARYVKPGEMLAMDPSRIHRGPAGFFWLYGDGPKPNERRGEVAIVHVRGELEHHKDRWGCAESYEGIVEKFGAALSGEDATKAYELAARQANYGDLPADFQPLAKTPPKKLVLCIDSPGGVVAGLNETHATLLRMKVEAKIPVVVIVNEMAASAAYALATVGDRIICPRSAILGSVGVISTMISQARKNKEDGYDVELITSGARKADGHLHAPISAAAVAVERGRVMKLAADFWAMVSKARRIPVAKIRGFEAAIFLGSDAKRVGLADAVGNLETVLAEGAPPAKGRAAGGNETDRRLRSVDNPVSSTSTERGISMKLQARLMALMAVMVGEADPAKRAAAARLIAKKGALLASKAEEGDDDPDDDEEGDDEEESKAAKAAKKAEAAKKAAEAAQHRAKSAEFRKKAEEAEEKAKMAEADDEEKAKAEGDDEKAKTAATAGHDALLASLAKSVGELKQAQTTNAKATLIGGARKLGAITKTEAAWLDAQTLAAVESFLQMRAKAGLVVVDEDQLLKPKHTQPGTEESLPEETRAMIASAVDAFPGDKKAYRETLVKAHLEAHTKATRDALAGAGRY